MTEPLVEHPLSTDDSAVDDQQTSESLKASVTKRLMKEKRWTPDVVKERD